MVSGVLIHSKIKISRERLVGFLVVLIGFLHLKEDKVLLNDEKSVWKVFKILLSWSIFLETVRVRPWQPTTPET